MADEDTIKVLGLVDRIGPALRRRDRAALNGIITQLLALQAQMGEQWEALAQIAAHNGEITLARAAIDRYVDALNGSAAAQYQKAGLIAHWGGWREAYDLLSTLPPTVPTQAHHAYSRGTSAMYLGQTAEAREQLERATQLMPQLGSAWHSLSTVVDLAGEPELAERLFASEPTMQGAAPIERAAHDYALGKIHDRRGDHAKAFAAFARGAARMKSASVYDRDADRASAQEAVRGYDAKRIAAIADEQRESTARTIFVTGLPRSGTTLVEQILTRHSAVTEGAETGRLGLIASDVGGTSWQALRAHTEGHGVAPAARLWNHWMEERFPASQRVVEKSIDSSRYLGLAAALLPDAPLIWVRRDPLDRAWSCFRTFFVGNISWSYDLEDIAYHFRLEDQLLSQWQAILGARLLVVDYEALVGDPDASIGRLLDHCGLATEPQPFSPHESRRAVTTSSVMQVRRPINRDAIGAAEPYRAFLRPFIEAYRA